METTLEGNISFRELIAKNNERYQNAKGHAKKNEIIVQIFQDLRNQNSRFMIYNESDRCWDELSEKDALKKIGQVLREKRKKNPSSNDSRHNAQAASSLIMLKKGEGSR